MSTRALYTFRDNDGEYHVYKHHDGYPSGAIEAILNSLMFAWNPPRFEADEFAAAFVAGNKSHGIVDLVKAIVEKIAITKSHPYRDYELVFTKKDPLIVSWLVDPKHGGGSVRLMPSGDWKKIAPSDIEYRYEITYAGGVMVRGFEVGGWGSPMRASELFYLPLSKFQKMDRKELSDWQESLMEGA